MLHLEKLSPRTQLPLLLFTTVGIHHLSWQVVPSMVHLHTKHVLENSRKLLTHLHEVPQVIDKSLFIRKSHITEYVVNTGKVGFLSQRCRCR